MFTDYLGGKNFLYLIINMIELNNLRAFSTKEIQYRYNLL